MQSLESFDIHITPATVAEWRREASNLQEKIKEMQSALDMLHQRIAAVPLFVSGGRGSVKAMVLAAEAEHKAEIPLAEMNPVAAVLAVLEQQGSMTVTVKWLRRELERQGYPMRKFGKGMAYFYQILSRLDGKRIERHGDEVTLRQ